MTFLQACRGHLARDRKASRCRGHPALESRAGSPRHNRCLRHEPLLISIVSEPPERCNLFLLKIAIIPIGISSYAILGTFPSLRAHILDTVGMSSVIPDPFVLFRISGQCPAYWLCFFNLLFLILTLSAERRTLNANKLALFGFVFRYPKPPKITENSINPYYY